MVRLFQQFTKDKYNDRQGGFKKLHLMTYPFIIICNTICNKIAMILVCVA